ncbi:hypothetical protein ACFOZ5_12465 [Marinobacter lacisalsi]|uniref:Transmembrane protein n=1 Tax=Marinobacter lacisalsi TaxID=475979 RepID=A0ABV8QHN1_9GAMM
MEGKSGKLLAAGLAFALWGGWALLANWQAGVRPALMAGLLQGAMSFLVTLLMASAVIWQVRRLRRPAGKILVPTLLTVSVTGSLLYLLHTLSGTPGVWRTIVPPTTVAFFYCLLLSVESQRQASIPDQPG